MTSRLHTILFALALAAAATPALAGAAVTVKVIGITEPKGFMMIALYDEAHWSGASVARARVPVTGNTVTTVLQAPAPGRYGIKMYQDVDGNGEMETNIVGMPTEPIGFSNNARGNYGPPGFADAGFDVGAVGAAQTITVN